MRATKASASVGQQIASARERRGWTQDELAAKVGISQTRQSQIELGRGRGAPADLWFAYAEVLAIPLRFEFGRDPAQELEDAGHLELQEFMLGLARGAGLSRTFELPTRPASPALSVDVGLRDDVRRLLVLEECWNTFGNLGGSVRNTRRKIVELEAQAVALGGEEPYRVAACWVVRDVGRNREIVNRYPQVFESTFTGSSAAWVRALSVGGANPPLGLGLVWADPKAGRLTAWRRGSRGAS